MSKNGWVRLCQVDWQDVYPDRYLPDVALDTDACEACGDTALVYGARATDVAEAGRDFDDAAKATDLHTLREISALLEKADAFRKASAPRDHGNCQAHYIEKPCRVAAARATLAVAQVPAQEPTLLERTAWPSYECEWCLRKLDASALPAQEERLDVERVREAARAVHKAGRQYSKGRVTLDADAFDNLYEAALALRGSS